MSIKYLNSTGFWYYQAYEWDNLLGKSKRIQKSLKTRDETEAEKRRKEYDRKRKQNRRQLPKRERLLSVQVERYLKYRKNLVDQGGLSQRSLELDRRYLTRFLQHMVRIAGDIPVSNVNHAMLERFWGDGIREGIASFDGQGIGGVLSHETLRGFLRHIRTFFSRLRRDQIIDESPFSRFSFPARQKKIDVVTPTGQEWERLRTYLSQQIAEGEMRAPIVILYIMVLSGCRVGEVRTLKYRRTKPFEYLIEGLHQKYSILSPECDRFDIYWKKQFRSIPIPKLSGLMSKLKNASSESEYVFPSPQVAGQPIGYNAVKRRLKRISEELGLSPLLTTHSLRRGFITSLVDAGQNLSTVSEYVGHSTTYITENFYKTTDQDILNRFAQTI